MATKEELIDRAVALIARGDVLTMDSLARDSGLTKAGVIHYFPSKAQLMDCLVDHVVARWETGMRENLADDASPRDRLRAYVDYAFAGTFDQSDLAILADVRLRERLRDRWTLLLADWTDPGSGEGSGASGLAARLLADGVWFHRALGTSVVEETELAAVRAIALQLVDRGDDA